MLVTQEEVMTLSEQIDVIVIGAGQAGLSIGYHLAQSQLSYLIIGSEQRIGDIWRQRYDSLVLFTPRAYSSLPGRTMPGDPDGFPDKNETADYLENYALYFQLQVQLGTEVLQLVRSSSGFHVRTNKGEYMAKQVVIATGPFQRPYIPDWASSIGTEVLQLHSSQYRRPEDLPEGPVLIVGAGNSGAQLAVELAESRRVILSTGHPITFIPMMAAGRSVFYWFDKLGLLRATTESWLGRRIRRRPDPIFGLDLKRAISSSKVEVKPRAVGARHGHGLVELDDGSIVTPASVIWATGFRPDYSWVRIPELFDTQGKPKHRQGISPIDDLYYLGLPWQRNRGSALLGGVGRDAEFISKLIVERRT
jgi:putative flavoprotein involved in K+ transport